MTEERNQLAELFAACWKDEALKARFMNDPKAVLAECDMPSETCFTRRSASAPLTTRGTWHSAARSASGSEFQYSLSSACEIWRRASSAPLRPPFFFRELSAFDSSCAASCPSCRSYTSLFRLDLKNEGFIRIFELKFCFIF